MELSARAAGAPRRDCRAPAPVGPQADAPTGALLDWCDVRGVDLEAFVVRKAAGDRVVLDDRTSLLGDVLGARALLECVAR